jgi:hypothetical protein
MLEKINWSFKVQVTNGPTLTESGELTVDAYDVVEATIPKTGDAVTIAVQPDGAQFIYISATSYKDLSYTVDGGSDVTFDAAHILIGEGAAGLLGATQQEFVFTNADTTADTKVRILVGRKATS